jgi:hypothetical protein
MKCPSCHSKILHDSPLKVYDLESKKWFCTLSCSWKYQKKKEKLKLEQLKEEETRRKQQQLMRDWNA